MNCLWMNCVKNQVRHIFDSANFVRDLGMQLVRIEDEYCETILVPAERHRQQHGLIHAGVMATMADHTSGCAARGAVGLTVMWSASSSK